MRILGHGLFSNHAYEDPIMIPESFPQLHHNKTSHSEFIIRPVYTLTPNPIYNHVP